MYEWKRIFCRPKYLLLLLLTAVVNLALFAGFCRAEQERSSENPYFTVAEHEQDAAYLSGGYDSYLAYVGKQSQGQSVLASLGKQSPFVERSRKKTADDYADLSGITLTDGENRGIRALFNFSISEYLMLLAPILLALELASERGTASCDLTRTTRHGRCRLTISRAAALFFLSALSVILLFGSDILFGSSFFGSPNLRRTIQSIRDFQLCPYRLSIGGCLLCTALLKIAAVFLLALTAWLIFSVCQQVLAFLLMLLLNGGAFLCFQMILPTASLCHFKFCNPFALLDAGYFFQHYCNLNFFGYPRGFLASALLICGILLAVILSLCVFLIGICRPMRIGSGMERLKIRVSKWLSKFQMRHSLFFYEGKKLLLAEGGIVVLLFGGVAAYSISQDIRLYTPLSVESRAMYNSFEGEITDEKLTKCAKKVESLQEQIERLEAHLADLEEQGSLNQNEINETEAENAAKKETLAMYQTAYDCMDDLRAFTAETGLPAWFVRDNAYQLQFHESAAERRCCMILLILLIFLFSPIEAFENQYAARTLLRSARRGRGGMRRCKLLWIALLTLAASVVLHGVYTLHVAKDVGFALPDAPAQSLKMFQFLPISVSLRTCIAGLFGLRFLAAYGVALLIAAIGRKCRNPQTALFVCLTIFLLPAALTEAGAVFLAPLDTVRYLCLVQ